MNFDFKDKKIWIGLIIIVALVLLIYMFFNNPAIPEGDFLLTGIDPMEEVLGRDVLNLVQKMEGVELNTTIFEEPAFKSLQDFEVKIPKQPIGRRDPFAPL